MLSELIHSQHSYPAMPRARQLVHQRLVHPGPLVLRANLLKYQRLQQIGDQPVSRFFSCITAWNGLYHRLIMGMVARLRSRALIEGG